MAARLCSLEHVQTRRDSTNHRGPEPIALDNDSVYRLRVHHAAWPLRRARLERLVTTLPKAAGIDVGDPIDLVLASAEGVTVETFGRERVQA